MNTMVEAMVEANLEGLASTGIHLALGGNVPALRMLKIFERPVEKTPHIPKSYDELGNIYREMMQKSYDTEITMKEAKRAMELLEFVCFKLIERRPTFTPPKG